MTTIHFVLAVLLLCCTCAAQGAQAARPNIVWITCEDISPNLGCYGDRYAVTPNLDRLAEQSVRYTHAFAPTGVCAPARSCLIMGMYPTSLGTQHMRCQGTLPEFVKCFPAYLREAGYYCTNNVKTDYNFRAPEGSWDDSSKTAHYRNRAPGQPFFAVFNLTSCHESQIRLTEEQYERATRGFSAAERHDPAEAPLPPYHPDAPEIRRDWARYYDMITRMDREVGKLLDGLNAAGLADETIVFFFSDHGAGMPRSKRWLYDSSTRVPMLVRFPPAFAKLAPVGPGETIGRLVSFVDFGPTVLSLAGVAAPGHMQGEAFLGAAATAPRQYVYGFRDRMDDRIDLLRSVRDQRFNYVRNYLPHLPWFGEQYISYMYEMPTMRVWQRLADAGELHGPAALFMAARKPAEELYDVEADPWETNNLADDPRYAEELARLRAAQRRWILQTRDLGFLPEAELRARFGDESPYEAVRCDPNAYPLERVLAVAELASRSDGGPRDYEMLVEALGNEEPAIRCWGAIGLAICAAADDAAASQATVKTLERALNDPHESVRLYAADALARTGQFDKAVPALAAGLASADAWARLQAVNMLDRLDDDAQAAFSAIAAAAADENEYVRRVVAHVLAERDDAR